MSMVLKLPQTLQVPGCPQRGQSRLLGTADIYSLEQALFRLDLPSVCSLQQACGAQAVQLGLGVMVTDALTAI